MSTAPPRAKGHWAVQVVTPQRAFSVALAPGKPTVVGRGRSAGIEVARPEVAERQLVLVAQEQWVRVEPLAAAATSLNDVPLDGPVQARRGDELSFGDARLVLGWALDAPGPTPRLASEEELWARLPEELQRAQAAGQRHGPRAVGLTLVATWGMNVSARQAMVKRLFDAVAASAPAPLWAEVTEDTLALVLAEQPLTALATLQSRLPQLAGPRARVASARFPEEAHEASGLLELCWQRLSQEEEALEPLFTDAASVRLASLVEGLAGQASPVLFLGPVGSGKRTLARLLAGAAGRTLSPTPSPRGLHLVAGAERLERAALDEVLSADRPLVLTATAPLVVPVAFTVEVPALAARPDDILPLAEHFLVRARSAFARARLTLSEEAHAPLLAHAWPGNVRELKLVMTRAARAAVRDEVGLDALPRRLTALGRGRGFRASLESAERELFLEVLSRTRWNVTQAAARLGMPRRTVVYRMARLGLKRPRR